MPLYDPENPSESAGFLTMKFQWVDFLEHGELGHSQSVLEVKVGDVFLPSVLGDGVALCATFKDLSKTTPFVRWEAERSTQNAVTLAMDDMLRRCKERGYSPEEIEM